MRITLVSIFLLLACGTVVAQPAQTSRVLRTIDFEERRLGNNEDLPMHWQQIEGNGLPNYIRGRLTTDRAHSGDYSFRFDLNGGSLIYRYDPRQIPVQRGAHYRVAVFVTTTVMPHARARLTAFLTDLDGHARLASLRHSEPYSAAADGEPWHQLEIQVSANDPRDAMLVVELELVQPSIYSTATLGDRSLFPQDIHGTAWFDDVTVSQVPRVALTTDQPGNVFPRGKAVRLSVTVNDRFTDDLSAQLKVSDAAGRAVYERSGAMDISRAQTLGPGQKRLILQLPELSPGWFRASLVMNSHGQFVGEQSLDLVLLADDAAPIPPDNRFGLIATHLPIEGWNELPRILPTLSAGRVKLAVWSRLGDAQQVDANGFDNMLEQLQVLSITPTACLVDPPPSVTEKIGGTSWLQLLAADPKFWQPQLAYLISRHANHLDRWQLGDDGSDAFVKEPKMRQVYAKIYSQFAQLIEKPDLAMPWPAWYDLEGELPATIALSVPPSVLPAQLPLYIQDINARAAASGGKHILSLSLEPLDAGQYGRDVQIRDLAQRVVYALAGGADRIDLPLPMDATVQDERLISQPQELFMIERTLIRTLSGATFKGKVPIGDDVAAFLFDRQGHGILVLWSRGDRNGLTPLALNLGDRPLRVDLWGNVTPLAPPIASALLANPARPILASAAPASPASRVATPGSAAAAPAASDDSSRIRLDLGSMPIILLDIDGQIAQIRASVRLDQPLLESSFRPQMRHVRFVNPYASTMSGTLRLRPPPGWTLNPPTFNFTLNAGETFDREISIEFPYNSFAGPKTIMADFQIQADRNLDFSVPITLNLGLSDVGMQTLALRDKQDVIVQQMITNYGDQPVNYSAFAVLPGQARQERLVTGLGAGRTIMKIYRFENAKIEPGTKIRTGLKELVGSRILNDEVPVQ
jgi:hypothetical protein